MLPKAAIIFVSLAIVALGITLAVIAFRGRQGYLGPTTKFKFQTTAAQAPLWKKPLVIVGIFKNEAHILREWLNHYIKQGVEHFYLTDNGSTDNWRSQITNLPVTIREDTKRHAQAWHYNQYLDTVKKNAEWVLVVDLDEFMYARFDKDLPTALNKYDKNIGQIKVRMKYFGSHGHVKQPENVIHNFYSRMKGLSKNGGPKSFIRTANLVKFNIHTSQVKNCKEVFEPEEDTPGIKSENALQKAPIHLNHYVIQSLDWYKKTKMRRGAADVKSKDGNKKYNLTHFKKYDYKDIFDNELSLQTRENYTPSKKTYTNLVNYFNHRILYFSNSFTGNFISS